MQRSLAWFLAFFILAIEGHVRLDFPLARDLSLDFLDNVRTPAPCGMPKGPAKTSLKAGNDINVTWHLAYPHQGKRALAAFISVKSTDFSRLPSGGFKLELFDSEGNFLETLTDVKGGSKSDGWIDFDTTAQSHLVSLPQGLECEECTVSSLPSHADYLGSKNRMATKEPHLISMYILIPFL